MRARPQTARARISNSVSGGQCHLIHLSIIRRFSWPSLAHMCTQVAFITIHFILFALDIAIFICDRKLNVFVIVTHSCFYE